MAINASATTVAPCHSPHETRPLHAPTARACTCVAARATTGVPDLDLDWGEGDAALIRSGDGGLAVT